MISFCTAPFGKTLSGHQLAPKVFFPVSAGRNKNFAAGLFLTAAALPEAKFFRAGTYSAVGTAGASGGFSAR